MVPYLDLFNHVNDNNTYYFFDDKRDGFVLYAIRDINKNEEITVSYGAHTNLYLYTAYGFILKNNKFRSCLTLYLKEERFTLNGYVKEEDIFLIRNRLLMRNKMNYREGMILIRDNLDNRMKEYDRIKTNDINIRNLILEQREIVNKYTVIINKLLLKNNY